MLPSSRSAGRPGTASPGPGGSPPAGSPCPARVSGAAARAGRSPAACRGRSGSAPALITMTASRRARRRRPSRTGGRSRNADATAARARGRRRRGSARHARCPGAPPPGNAGGSGCRRRRGSACQQRGAVTGAEPALEVHGPDVVASPHRRAERPPAGRRRRRRLRRAVSPSRANSSPIVLAAGQSQPECRRSSAALTFTGPRVGMPAAQGEQASTRSGATARRCSAGRARPLDEPGAAFRPPAPQPPIAGIAADPELPAQRRDRHLPGRRHTA